MTGGTAPAEPADSANESGGESDGEVAIPDEATADVGPSEAIVVPEPVQPAPVEPEAVAPAEEVAVEEVATEETPAEEVAAEEAVAEEVAVEGVAAEEASDKPKRRGWWQRGRLF